MTTAAPPPAGSATMARLKAETADLHQAAETSQFQRALVKGELAPAAYAAWLGQMLLIHDALEGALREARAASPALAQVDRREYDRADDLRSDLVDLAADPDNVEPLGATSRLCDAIGSSDALGLLGMRYVLEGSNNGNRFIAAAIRRAMPDAPTRYLDPYGESQRSRWAAFREDMERNGFGPDEQDQLVAAARLMFKGVGELSRELAGRTLGGA
ncbi:MAG: biliverdin-producing heme oxygenase [Phycisphaerales bacterium JB039]